MNERRKLNHQKNQEHDKAYRQEYQQNNRDKINERKKHYRENNKEKLKEAQQEYMKKYIIVHYVIMTSNSTKRHNTKNHKPTKTI